MGYVLTISILGLCILIHESGHLIAAKYAKIPIERFSVGFGPRLFGFRKNETEYWLSLIPLGGYVLPLVKDGEDFSRSPLLKRLLFCLGGPMANIMAALICMAAVNALGQGISFSSVLLEPLLELGEFARQIISVVPALYHNPDKLSGVIGIVALGGQYAGTDIARLLKFSIFMNVNLAVFNMLPIPPLDGGRIVFYILENIYKPLMRLQTPLTVTGWLLMVALLLYTAIADVGHLIIRAQV